MSRTFTAETTPATIRLSSNIKVFLICVKPPVRRQYCIEKDAILEYNIERYIVNLLTGYQPQMVQVTYL